MRRNSGAIMEDKSQSGVIGSILIVEDEPDLANMLLFNLEREGFQCQIAASGDEAIGTIDEQHPELVILDRMLPGLSGDEVLMHIKRRPETAGIPVIMVTAKGMEEDQIDGLSLGADDYITKPFSMKVLLARIEALSRRVDKKAEDSVLQLGPVQLDSDFHKVMVEGAMIELTATEFRLLQALMSSSGRVLDRQRLMQRVCGVGAVVSDRTIDVHVTALRKKLGPASAWLQTVRGVGYAFRVPE